MQAGSGSGSGKGRGQSGMIDQVIMEHGLWPIESYDKPISYYYSLSKC
jgi:hypothetical protein